jgi:hypothetical protein
VKNGAIGLGLSLLPAALFAVPDLLVLAAVAVLAVFVAGLAVQIRAGLAAMRVPRNPLRPVLDATACYWLGASVGSTLAWTALLSSEFAFPVEAGLRVGLGDLLALWVYAAVTGAVVAAVTSAAWRAASPSA